MNISSQPQGGKCSDHSSEYFALKCRSTGELVRVSRSSWGDEAPTLSDDEHAPVFKADSEGQLMLLLMENTPSYNASERCPSWGSFRKDDLMPVKVRETIQVDELELKEPPQVRTHSVRDIPYSVARGYAGGNFEADGETRVVFWLVELPEGMNLQDATAWEGLAVLGGDKYSRRKLYKALAVPEDYVDLLEGKNGALFLASNHLSYPG